MDKILGGGILSKELTEICKTLVSASLLRKLCMYLYSISDHCVICVNRSAGVEFHSLGVIKDGCGGSVGLGGVPGVGKTQLR